MFLLLLQVATNATIVTAVGLDGFASVTTTVDPTVTSDALSAHIAAAVIDVDVADLFSVTSAITSNKLSGFIIVVIAVVVTADVDVAADAIDSSAGPYNKNAASQQPNLEPGPQLQEPLNQNHSPYRLLRHLQPKV